MRIAVSGASGFVASELIPLLIDQGHSLLLICRNPKELGERHHGQEVVSPLEWEARAVGFDVFLHLAGLNTGKGFEPTKLLETNSALTSFYAEGAKRVGISRFIFVSTWRVALGESGSSYVRSKGISEGIARSTYGEACEIVRLGYVFGEKFGSRLSFLSHLPRPIALKLFSLASSLKPSTSVSLLAAYITEPRDINQNQSGILTLTDSARKRLFYRGWRWVLDFSFVLGVALLLPAILLIWLAIVLSDGLPGFFLQDRIGKGGQIYACIKFRTMKNGAESAPTHLVDQGQILPIGRLLRRLKLDELPQAINVARGEMTLIGPRPSLPGQTDVITSRASSSILDVLPGLTGWAQVNGVDMRDSSRLSTFDSSYLANQSIWLDVLVLWKTLYPRGGV